MTCSGFLQQLDQLHRCHAATDPKSGCDLVTTASNKAGACGIRIWWRGQFQDAHLSHPLHTQHADVKLVPRLR